MKPITELTIGHIGQKIHVHDRNIDISGVLFHLDARTNPQRSITIGIGGAFVSLLRDATWETP